MNRIELPNKLVPRPCPCGAWRMAIAIATLSFLIAVPASDADAQGPLRRLGDRLRGRILIQPVPSNPYGQPQGQATPRVAPAQPSANRDDADPSRSANFRRPTPPPPQPGGRAGSGSDAWSDRNVARGTKPSDTPEPPTDSGNKSRLGVTIDTPAEVVSATGIARRPRGAMVTAVTPRSPADIAGVKAGDRIVAVDGRLVNSVQDLVGELARHEPGQKLKLQYSRGDRLETAEVALATRDQIAQASAATPEATETPNTSATAGGNKSILGGLGSALGGLLTGKGKGVATDASKSADTPTDKTSTDSAETAAATQANPTQANLTQVDPTPAPPKPGNTPPITSVPAPDAKPLGVDPRPLAVDPTPLEQLKPEPLPATAPERLP